MIGQQPLGNPTGDPAATAKCVSCGRFLSFKEMERGGGAYFYFEPDSHKGREVCEWTCAKCAAAEIKER